MSKFDQCHLRWRGKVTGPFTWTEIERKLDAHEIGLLHDLQQGSDWTTLGEYLAGRGEIVRVGSNVSIGAPPTAADLRSDSTAQPAAASNAPRLIRIPNRWIFIVLGLLFGFLGLHDFYAHHWIRGAILLAIALLVWWLDWGIIWPWLWALGEIIVTKIDGKGRRMPWKKSPPPIPPQTPP
jgi:TM2 domain-containing membrane protein YozV